MSPMVKKALVVAVSAAVFYFSGGKMSFEAIVGIVTGLISGLAFPEFGKRS